MPEDRAQSARIVRARERGMTDSDFASITLCINVGVASRDLGRQMARSDLSTACAGAATSGWTALPPGTSSTGSAATLRIGGAVLEMRERIDPLPATTANPDTGERDADTLGALKQLGPSGFRHLRASSSKAGEIARRRHSRGSL